MSSRTRRPQRIADIEIVDEAPAQDRAEVPATIDADPPAETGTDSLPAAAQAHAVVTAPEPATSRHAYLLAAVASLVWAGGLAAFAAYEFGRGDLEPVTVALLVLMAVAPAGLMMVTAQLVRQASRLAAESGRARGMADALLAPTALAASGARDETRLLTDDISAAVRVAEQARAELSALRQALETDAKGLNEAADQAQRTARRLSEQLGREREQLSGLAEVLDRQATQVLDAVERQARMVADASDLAQSQLREAEAALTARTADMAAAAGEAQDAARVAAEDLQRQTIRLETAGSGVADQIRSVEEGLSEQRAALVQAAFGLRRDQEDFAAQIESQRAQLAESLSLSQSAAGDLGAVTQQGAQALQDLVEAALDQFKALSQLADTEAHAFDARTREALDRFEALAAEARDTVQADTAQALTSLEAAERRTREAAEAVLAQAQARIDRLAETSFEAGARADQAIEDRMVAVRAMMEETVQLAEATGRRVVDRLESDLDRARQTLAQVEGALGEIDARAARLPEDARARIDDIRAAVEGGLESITEATRRAAEETEAADHAFQERVKRNYDMLTEAVRLMGVVSGEAGSGRRSTPDPEIGASAAPSSRHGARRAETSASAGLRGPLRLTPTASDAEFREVFEGAGGPAPAGPARREAADLSWKDLLGPDTADAEPAPVDDESLTERVTGIIRGLGIDPAALLPRTRVHEAAQAALQDDPDRVRLLVRRVAPAAVRRLSRLILTDRETRSDMEAYARHYGRVVADAAAQPDAERMVLSVLTSDPGRAYLLVDAASADLS